MDILRDIVLGINKLYREVKEVLNSPAVSDSQIQESQKAVNDYHTQLYMDTARAFSEWKKAEEGH